jgi:8-oxo-dGTP diphosphatase
MDKNLYKRVVVAFLHKNFDSYLLQLRDFNSSITYPGHWGAFGGALEKGELPKTAVFRELTEEIGYTPEDFSFFCQTYKDEHKLNIYVFFSEMNVSAAELNLMEGMDMGMFTKEEILTKNLYSQKLGKAFPVAPLLSEIFDEFFKYIDENIRSN